jgi:hypothetical protein
MAKMKHQELLWAGSSLHILHQGSEVEFCGQWIIHELAGQTGITPDATERVFSKW